MALSPSIGHEHAGHSTQLSGIRYASTVAHPSQHCRAVLVMTPSGEGNRKPLVVDGALTAPGGVVSLAAAPLRAFFLALDSASAMSAASRSRLCSDAQSRRSPPWRDGGGGAWRCCCCGGGGGGGCALGGATGVAMRRVGSGASATNHACRRASTALRRLAGLNVSMPLSKPRVASVGCGAPRAPRSTPVGRCMAAVAESP